MALVCDFANSLVTVETKVVNCDQRRSPTAKMLAIDALHDQIRLQTRIFALTIVLFTNQCHFLRSDGYLRGDYGNYLGQQSEETR